MARLTRSLSRPLVKRIPRVGKRVEVTKNLSPSPIQKRGRRKGMSPLGKLR